MEARLQRALPIMTEARTLALIQPEAALQTYDIDAGASETPRDGCARCAGADDRNGGAGHFFLRAFFTFGTRCGTQPLPAFISRSTLHAASKDGMPAGRPARNAAS